MAYRFFFSYSSETLRASEGRLEAFFDSLCKRVHLKAGGRFDDIGFRDKTRLTMGSFWGPELVRALQESRVLVAVISPHYLESLPCGREFEFFLRRFKELPQHGPFHRVVPIFWVDKADCRLPPHAEAFFQTLQLTAAGMPETYPFTGLDTYYLLDQKQFSNQMLLTLGNAIKELSDLDPLPQLVGPSDFSELPSFFHQKGPPAKSQVGSGPTATNVVYAVATQPEAAQHIGVQAQGYAAERHDWMPFVGAPGASIELATLEGLNAAGQDREQYHELSLADDLTDPLRQAQAANSPVLFVLDHASLRVPAVADPLSKYDGQDFRNVGLVSAAGSDTDEPIVQQWMPVKYTGKRQHHLWTVPSTRERYVQDVFDVVGGLRRGLQQTGTTAISPVTRPLPGV